MQTIKQGLGYRWLIWEAIPEAQAREWGKWKRKRGKSIKGVLMGSLLNFTVTFRGTVWNMPHNCSIKGEGSWSIYTLTPIPHYLGVAPRAVIHLALLGCPTGRLNKPSGKKQSRQVQELEVEKLSAYWKLFCRYQWTRGGRGKNYQQGLLLAPETPCSGWSQVSCLINHSAIFCGHSDWVKYGHVSDQAFASSQTQNQCLSFLKNHPFAKKPPICPEVTFFLTGQ